MISRLTGRLIEKSPPTICIDVNGVAYDVDVSMSTLYDLPDIGQTISLYTHLAIREDAHVLYGFTTTEERHTFRQLIKVSGIGARTALAILSGMDSASLSLAIEQQESALLTKIPGIGAKTAARLLLELKGKLASATPLSAQPSAQQDILNALLALGYSEKDAQKVLKDLPSDIEVAEGIRLALQKI